MQQTTRPGLMIDSISEALLALAYLALSIATTATDK